MANNTKQTAAVLAAATPTAAKKAAPKAKPAAKKAAAAKTATAKPVGDTTPAPTFTGQALGMVETRGLVAAIEAADNMLKTADVALLGTERVGSGLVTVLVCGEVSAVASAVQSGAAAAARLGDVVSTDIIARPAQDVGGILPTPR